MPATETRLTDRLTAALLSNKDGKPLYTVSLELDEIGGIVLTGRRGARYVSIENQNDHVHRFMEKPVESYKLAILPDGRVALAVEALSYWPKIEHAV